MNILVTGGAGFIGSHIVDALIAQEHRVVIVDDLSTGSRRNINAQAMFYKLDIRSSRLEKIVRDVKPQAVFHHAAQMDVRRSVQDPVFDAQTNILGTIRLLAACEHAGVTNIVFASSGGAVYGDGTPLPTLESAAPSPASPYGIGKLAGEHYLRYTGARSRCRWVALRYANVYGPRQNSSGEAGVIAIFAQKMLTGSGPVINGDGRQTRDFVFVDDIVRANIAAVKSKKNGIYNIGTGRQCSINTVARLVARAAGYKPSIAHGPAKEGEQRKSAIDSHKAKEQLRWNPEVALEEGIEKTVAWFRQRKAR
ncbi:NAD-dependent epimerase/dehydratase family protein [Candidatus Uhrbacteria bacterium]|nr:NAD-dependent epimerase/dehydratase family protein [Candidatus Uhrbacteria bacterium]